MADQAHTTETRDTREAHPEDVLAALGEVIGAVSASGFDLNEVLESVIRNAVELSRADFGNIVRPDDAGTFYRVVAYHGKVSQAYWDLALKTPYRPSRDTLIGRTLIERRPVHIVDVLADADYHASQLQAAGNYRTILGVPMLHGDDVIGLFVVWREHVEPFTERQVGILKTFADQAVVAIENLRLFQTVERQRSELARFAPQVAALLAREGGQELLAGHRREITAMFADLRGFTSFAESAEPEEVLGILRDYHALVGETVVAAGGTVEHFAGDGLMAFFNDPNHLADHQAIAVRAAVEIRDRFDAIAEGWRRRGYELGLGIGLAVGFATLGRIGFEGRFDYGAVGNVVILASRLSDAAQPGQILLSQRLNAAVEGVVATRSLSEQALKGFTRPIPVFEVAAGGSS